MKYTLENNSKGKKTKIVIGPEALDSLAKLAEGRTKTALLTDESSAKNCLDKIKKYLDKDAEIIILPDGENNKDLKYVEDVLRRLREAGFDRKSLLIGLGGGVINDIAGFAASMYMRGIDWVMVATTLTAQADAAIGGKTGVNLGGYKNMIGSFWPAAAVLSDPAFLATLPERHLKNGLAEIIKMGFIRERKILDHIDKVNPEDLLGAELEKASELSAKTKVEIVNADMFEAGERKLLNFGHTIGHAPESAAMDSEDPLLHGEAVSIGMVAEARLGELEGISEKGLSSKISQTLEKFRLPVSYNHAVLGDIFTHIASDKKNIGSDIYWTLPKAEGQGIYNYIARQENVTEAIKSVLA
jgi:3-dehydroquinate synthase